MVDKKLFILLRETVLWVICPPCHNLQMPAAHTCQQVLVPAAAALFWRIGEQVMAVEGRAGGLAAEGREVDVLVVYKAGGQVAEDLSLQAAAVQPQVLPSIPPQRLG